MREDTMFDATERHRKALEGDDYIFREAPSWVPDALVPWTLDLTYDEVHAFVMGVATMMVAVFTGYWWLLTAGLMLAYGFRKTRTFVQRIIFHEPWYWAGGAVLAAPPSIVMDFVIGVA